MADQELSIIDEERLRLLSLGYKISAGIAVLFSLFALFYVFMGVVMTTTLSHSLQTNGNPANTPPPAFVGWLFGAIGLGLFVLMIAVAALKYRVAVNIKRRRSRIFCIIIAALGCLEFPYGIVLGVFTFLVLSRDSVRLTFEQTKQASAHPIGS